MVTLSGFSRSIATTKNFWDAFSLKISQQKKTILFRNGIKAETDWTEYCWLRDWFSDLRKLSLRIEKMNGEYRVWGSSPKLDYSASSLKDAHFFYHFILLMGVRGWKIDQIGDSLFSAKKHGAIYTIRKLKNNLFNTESAKIRMITPLDSLIVFFTESEMYECDCTNKTVLDVGGYCGETAVFFWSRGAMKIIVYEPVLAHHDFIKKNVRLSGIKAELHEEGIGKDDGTIAINYDYANQKFGLLSEGKSQSEIRIRNVTDAIIESKADIAKFDCEGLRQASLIYPMRHSQKLAIT